MLSKNDERIIISNVLGTLMDEPNLFWEFGGVAVRDVVWQGSKLHIELENNLVVTLIASVKEGSYGE
jgi:hypothetical protein